MSRKPLTQSAPAPALISVVRRPLGPSTKSNLVPVATSATAPANAVKTQIKLEDRLSKAEAKIHDLQREKTTVQNELGDLHTELRLAAHREAKLKHSLDKWEKSHVSLKEKSSKFADLQARLGELHKVHEESKARRQKEIDELTDKLRKEEDKRRHDFAEVRHSLAGEKAKTQSYEAKCSAIEAELEHFRMQASASSDILNQKQALIDELQAQRNSDQIIAIDAQKYARKIETQLNEQIEQLRAQISTKTDEAARTALEQQAASEAARSDLQAELEELLEEADQVEQLHAHNLAIVAKAVSQQVDALQQQLRLEKDKLRFKWHRNASERITQETLAGERASQIHELVAVVKQVQDDRDSAKQLVSTLQSDLVSIIAELNAERRLASLLIQQQEDQQQQRVNANSDCGQHPELTPAFECDDATISLLRSDLDDTKARIALLQEEAEELSARLIHRSTEAKAAEEALISARAQIANLEVSVAAKAREVDSLVSQLSELEPLRRRLASALEDASTARKEAQSHIESSRSLSTSLQNARVAEKAWRDDRDQMAAQLDQALHFEALYHELAHEMKHLIERNALAEEEKATLSALNSELLSHNNPMQKIMYMDRVRHELDDVKQENLSLRLQLERMEEENQMLGKELRAYKAVDVPLSQRPRAEVTRVLRAADHEGLLRQVSGSVGYQPEQRQDRSSMPAEQARAMVSTPVRSGLGVAASKTPFTAYRPKFTAVPLQPDLEETLQVDNRKHEGQKVEEHNAGGQALPHPPLPVDTGLSLKKRRSYGNLSVHAAQDFSQTEQHEVEDDTLLPLRAVDVSDDEYIEPEVAVKRNRPRATLVNSGALRVGPSSQPSSIPISSTAPTAVNSISATTATSLNGTGTRRLSLTTSSLGVKARRVSELVRASTPPLASVADFSNLETPNNNLVDAALPSPSAYGLADWTATDETSHVPGLNPHRGFESIPHSTPLAVPNNSARFRNSRYSGAQRVPLSNTNDIPRARERKGLMPEGKRNGAALVAVIEANSQVVYEDEHDSFQKGWLYDDDQQQVNLPDFSIENKHVVKKQQKQKLKARGSIKFVKSGPITRTLFR
ncbi:uncharacterized protein MEPE_03414 [Melanopsichium pennsylvanicum]|uniref:Uncharacterized protein n=2 Tax=Melanopsichium pennsylvanicum TaxID=63383 RepID=A0AAJ5C5G2_9BASI|nr:uncharacterized protein MEPE_03414 [Melanopsichium pennsylvanicum]